MLTGTDGTALRAALDAVARGEASPDVVRDTVAGGGLAIMFPGQGAQLVGMGAGLYAAHPGYAEAFDEVCAGLGEHLDRPVREVVHAEPGSAAAGLLDRTGYTQPALFAVEVALFRLLRSWGVRADVLIGHSVGEIAAAHVAGVLTLSDACLLVATRARLMQDLPGGAMAAIDAAEHEVAPMVAERRDDVAIAAVNGPGAVVVSGTEAAVSGIAAHWAGQGRRTRRLAVSHAFHSPLMEPMLPEFERAIGGLEAHRPRVPIISTVIGEPVADDFGTPGYWVRQVRATVRFGDAVRQALDRGTATFLEAGPGRTLSAAGAGAAGRPGGGRVRSGPRLRWRGTRGSSARGRATARARPRSRLVRALRRDGCPPRATAHLRLPARALLARASRGIPRPGPRRRSGGGVLGGDRRR
ncbi:acyltransferase domain-containing protein [Actinomadura madurae]|uniref:acyltransferase domain-containing protein n=1 Tax=Actinomadura madurae TaxID=1993 RepID=UPI0020D1F5D0|nr:acyltransferase domain-containing protein [Actinomadura madurae]MCP9984999.1 acyltransferase domain-containing protein [Actinomadura madurae]MCQ0021214.1 acyltransferase domain-containing protein [Actinomadura madurae]